MSVTENGKSRNNKESKQLSVSIAILEIIEKEGLLGVTHSKVARKSKVSRAWIYEYIGREKSALIEFAAEVFAGHIARVKIVELPKSKLELEDRLKTGVHFLFDAMEVNPLIIKLYFRFRGAANPVGKVIEKYEKQWLEGASKTLVDILNFSTEQAKILAEVILTLRLGFGHKIATSANLLKAREEAETVFKTIHACFSTTFLQEQL